MSASATLGGVPLTVVQAFGWAHIAGTKPYQRTFETSIASADKILAQRGGPLTLKIAPDDRKPIEIKGLWVLMSRPGSTPFTKALVVSDARWRWPRKVITRDFNMRRRTGENRLVGEGRLENKEIVPTIKFAPWSLDAGKPWTPQRVIADVLQELEPGNFVMPGAVRRLIDVEDLLLNHPGDQALEIVLAYLAGFDIRPDDDGRFYVYDTRDGSEAQAAAAAGPPLVDTGFNGLADRTYMRPSKINVLFERECELRFDYTEGENPGTTIRGDTRDPRKLENVVPCPDPTLVVSGHTVSVGTYIPIDDFLTAIAGSEPSSAPGPLSQTIIQKLFLGCWSYLHWLYGTDNNGNNVVLWSKRLGTIRTHWRATFRILPQWRDKIRSLRSYRAAVINPTTGTRAPAEAFMDYISKPSHAGIYKKVAQNPDIGRQVKGYPASGNLADGVSAPVDITVKDEEAGVIRVYLLADPFGDAEALAPGNTAALPKLVPQEDNPGTVLMEWEACELLSTFKLALVITAVQASPNNAGRFHKETVDPAAAGRVLGAAVGDCKGPEWTVFIGGGVQTARFAWSDANASQIEDAFFSGAPYPENLLVNKQNVQALAEAEAARLYGSMLERVEGGFSVALNPAVKITGAITQVEHVVNPNGACLTSLVLPPQLEPVDGTGYIPLSIQRSIRRMVQP